MTELLLTVKNIVKAYHETPNKESYIRMLSSLRQNGFLTEQKYHKAMAEIQKLHLGEWFKWNILS